MQRVVELADLDKLLLESDAPTQFRDIGDEKPSHVSMVAEKIIEIKGIEVDRVGEVTTRNVKRFFAL
ncbi:hypothetical protein AKJ62_00810 [candidate division MSBL1 archaeon SCGC-AAA259D14]|uniref:Uncharacterized protein n=1 Tax=candidate division MSBL1 archaeon SCGC-AAA259D14 TaxID=1698261 RepID=A0A133U8G2_9EURY|nr:hypothetical protein AKJ62_00810 [candidate division MSBL1 archaeon SCGC-AAA259D14]